MSRLLLTSDLHLGHKAICKYRTQFSSAEEHHEIIYDNLATNVNRRDSLILLGDIAFTPEWLAKIGEIKCVKKTLILGNHDLERGMKFTDLVGVYDDVQSLMSKRNTWFSHCPIHPQEMRNRKYCVHGHLHNKVVTEDGCDYGDPDPRYWNVCVEHTGYKPISFHELEQRMYD